MGKSASKEFSREVLKTHNDYRKKHGAPALKLCSKLCKEAQQYAEALASTRVLKHSPESSRGQCGENLAWASYDQPGKEVADRWYSEIKNYNFRCPGFSSGTGSVQPIRCSHDDNKSCRTYCHYGPQEWVDSGHFTAMIWKNSKKLGIGKASATDGSTFVVARYFPAGNIMNQGYFEDNVLPPKK